MLLLRQSTAATLRVGPFVDVADGATPETGVTLSGADQAEILKEGSGATVDVAGATWAAITGADGWYNFSLTTSHTDTLGGLTLVVQDVSVCLPVFVRAVVVPANVYDSLVLGTDFLRIDPGVTHSGTAQAGGANSITFAVGASSTNDFYNYGFVEITGGTGAGQGAFVQDYDGSSKVATVDRNWVVQPDNTSTYDFTPGSEGLTAAEVRAEMDANSTQFAKLGTPAVSLAADIAAADAVADAIKAKTDNLPSDPADASVVAGLIAAAEAKIDIIDSNVDTILAATEVYKKNTAVTAFMVPILATDGSPGTSLTISGEISKDGGSFAALTNAVAEVGSGWYKVNLTATEMNADEIAFAFTGTGARQRNIKIRTQS